MWGTLNHSWHSRKRIIQIAVETCSSMWPLGQTLTGSKKYHLDFTFLWMKKLKTLINLQFSWEWGFRYAHCIPWRDVKPSRKKSHVYDTKLDLKVRFLLWGFGRIWSTHSLPLIPGTLWFAVVVPARVSFLV